MWPPAAATARPVLLALCCLLLLAVTPCPAAEVQQQQRPAGTAECELRLAGARGGKQLVSARLACRGGSITAAAHQELARLLPRAPPGVAWSSAGACGEWRDGCLLTVCGDSAATFGDAAVVGVALANVSRLVCVGDRARLIWRGAKFADNAARPLSMTSKDASLVLIASRFERNRHDMGGGALYAEGGSLVAERCLFASNHAANDGGALCLESGARARLVACQLLNNTAGGTADDAAHSGGGVYAAGSGLDIRNSTLAGNVASWGGAVYVSGNSTAVVSACTITQNVAQTWGGGLDALGTSRVLLESVRLLNNTARQNDGGGIAVGEAANVTLRGASLLAGNRGQNGGALVLGAASRLTVVGARFAHNRADYGGAALVRGNSSLVLHRCRFEQHAATNNGGALNVEGTASLAATECVIDGASALYGGGLALYDNATARLHACTLRNLVASEQGGAASLVASARLNASALTVASCTAKGGGGGLILDGSSSATLLHSSVLNCTNSGTDSGGGGISVQKSARLSMSGGRVAGCSAQSGGALWAQDNTSALLDRVLVEHNTADYGGGCYASDNATLSLRACSVRACAASNNGGGIGCANAASLRLSAATRVSECSAGGWGGGMWLGSPKFDAAAVRAAASGNTAPHAPDVSVMTTRLAVLGPTSVPGFVSRMGGGLLRVNLNVTGVQGLPIDDVVEARVQGTRINTTWSGRDGIAHMVLKLQQPPGTYTVVFSIVDNSDVPSVNLTVHVTNCSVGDIMLSSGDACETCPQGYFSLDPRKSQCDLCPSANAECPGGSAIVPKAGYWHSAPRSAQIHRCLNPDACRGGVNTSLLPAQLASSEGYKAAQCADNYQGNLCAVCAPGHGTARAFTCRACRSRRIILTLYVLAALAMLGAVRLLVHFTLADSANASATTTASRPQPVDLLKPLVLYAQWLFIISSLANVPWPATLLVPLQGVAWFWSSASGSSLSLDCVLPRDSGVPLAMQKVLLSVCVPLALLLVLLAGEALLQRCSRRHRHEAAKSGGVSMADRVASVLMCVVFVFLPTWARTAFSLFACVPLDQPAAFPFEAAAVGSFWAEDTAQRCFAASHRAWALGLGVPLVLALCVLLPGGMAAFVWRNRTRLGSPAFRRHYGFLYHAWCDGSDGTRWVPWWESVVTLQTLVLVAISAFGYTLGPLHQLLALCAVLFMVFVLLGAVRPHANAVAGRVSLHGTGVLYVTCFSALTFLPYAPYTDAGAASHSAYCLVLGAVVLALNVAFVASVLWRLVRAVDWAGALGGMKRATAAAGRKAATCCVAGCAVGQTPHGRLASRLRSARSAGRAARMPGSPRSRPGGGEEAKPPIRGPPREGD